VKTRLK